MTGTIQGKDVIFYLLVDTTYLPYVCASDITIQVNAEKKSVKTIGDGAWDKFAYQKLSYTITLNGVLKFDTSNYTGWDFINYQMNFITVKFKATFTSGTSIRSVAGEVMIETSQLTVTPTDLVKESYTLPGTGAMIMFDGTNPCSIISTDLTFTQEAPGSPVQIFSTDTGGTAAQWKYSVDGGGDNYSSVNPFFVGVLSVGSHSFTVTPICSNGYEGTSRTENYTVV